MNQLWTLSREAEYAALDRAVRDPEKRRILYAMVDAVLRIKESGSASPADLAPLFACLEATDESVWGRAAVWLGKLVAYDPRLSEYLEGLSRHPSALVRNHLCFTLERVPSDVALPMLRRLLTDKSKKVRGTVMGVSLHAGHTSLLPDFMELLARSNDPGEQLDLQQTIALLQGELFVRDGFCFRRLRDGSIEGTPIAKSN